MLKKIIVKYKGIILFIIGSFLIVIALYLFLYSRIELVRERVFSEVDLLIENNGEFECNCNDAFLDDNSDIDVEVNTDFVETDDKNNSNNNDKDTVVIKKNYIGYLKIPRISLSYGFVSKDSYYNHVDRNIQIIEPSDFPNVKGGNFIIAGHSGTGSIAYFKNLYLLKIDDIAKVIYDGKTYTYKIKEIYKDSKDGKVVIKRDKTKSTLTLITCSYKDKKNQTIYIAELESVI